MGKRAISRKAREELLEALRARYRSATKAGKTRILDELVAVSGYHRKHAIRLLGLERGHEGPAAGDQNPKGRRIYDEAVKEALIVVWEAADRICGKRLKAILPELVAAMERHGHLHLDPGVRSRLVAASPATLDRLLAPVRQTGRPRKKRRRRPEVTRQVPVRTFADWNDPSPGYLEIDLVAHCGGSMAGAFIHTLVATDVSSGWTECVPLLAREQTLVVKGLEAILQQAPFPTVGLDSDNDSAFVNDTLISFCDQNNIEMTRSRAYRKNDQAWVEQKNGAIVRHMTGYARFSGIVAAQALAHLYSAVRLYVNFFQPSFKLRDKQRVGAKVKKRYHPPVTPCDRLLNSQDLDEERKSTLRELRLQLDPVALLHRIREGQSALTSLAGQTASQAGPGREPLDRFLAQLPRLWKTGEVRPTHQSSSTEARYWRTRQDPFEGVWLEILGWLQDDPDATAKALLHRLQSAYPGRFPDGQLRTLQRRVREWRRVMAKDLIYACIDETGRP